MTLSEFENTYTGQSLLYAANPRREYLRGQCVQPISFYVTQVWGKPTIWCDYAYQWFTDGQFSDQYTRVINNPDDQNQLPPIGAVIVWGSNSPGSGGGGHIAIVLSAGYTTFVSLDSNWGGKTLHRVTHNYDYIIGWLVPKNAEPEATINQGVEMIANTDQGIKIYKMLRPNSDPSQDELNMTVGNRTFSQFLNDAQAEITNRDSNLRAQNDQMAAMQTTINQLNQTVTQVTSDDAADKQTLADALTRIGSLTSELETTNDKIKDLQVDATTITQTAPATPNPTMKPIVNSWIMKFLLKHLPEKK